MSQSRPAAARRLPVEHTRHAFAYVFGGSGKFCNASGPLAVPTESVNWLDTAPPSHADNRSLILFDSGDEVTVQAGEDGIRFLLVSGKPLAGAGGVVRPNRDEHAGAVERCVSGIGEGHVFEDEECLVYDAHIAPAFPPVSVILKGMSEPAFSSAGE